MKINTLKIEMVLVEKGFSQRMIAEQCGVSRQSICTILRRGTCRPESVTKIAKALGVDPVDIIEM